MRKKKGAIELSVTYIVIIIISLVILGSSIQFARSFFKGAEELRQSVNEETEANILSLLNRGDMVALPINKREMYGGAQHTFGLGVNNVMEDADTFYVQVHFSKAFTPSEEPIEDTDKDYIQDKWILYNPGPYEIPNTEMEVIPIMIKVDKLISEDPKVATQPGTYIMNVCVYTDNPTGECGQPPLTQYYSGHVYKLYVEIKK